MENRKAASNCSTKPLCMCVLCFSGIFLDAYHLLCIVLDMFLSYTNMPRSALLHFVNEICTTHTWLKTPFYIKTIALFREKLACFDKDEQTH